MNVKCDHCPLLTEDRECPGQRNAGVCDRADPSSPKHNPGILEKIVNFAVAVVQHVAAGSPTAAPEQTAERLAICQECEHHDPDRDRCSVCGCGLSLKASWADQSCPLEKWGPVTPSASEEA